MPTSDGWEAVELDLAELDDAAAMHRTERENALSAAADTRPARPRRSRGRRASARLASSQFNRRMQMVLFVTLLLVGIAVVMRACGSGARASDTGPAAAATLTHRSCLP